jgi:ATP-dependent RNA circularization protein (DNA/RNA ligase family)
MTDTFFRFPRTPHLAWLGDGAPRDDKLLSIAEVDDLLAGEVVVEEKVDGANLGISVGSDGALWAQNRGQYLIAPYHGQFAPLPGWLHLHENVLFDNLGEQLILFGEWCAARHSVPYDTLPDWFLVFDVYDREARSFWDTSRRDDLIGRLGLASVPGLLRGCTTLAELTNVVETEPSCLGSRAVEGVVVRSEVAGWLRQRAKLVRPSFAQQIDEHWSRRMIHWNQQRVDPVARGRSASAG